MSAIFGFLLAAVLFWHFNRRTRYYRRRYGLGNESPAPSFEGSAGGGGPISWQAQWERHWAERFREQEERRERFRHPGRRRHRRRRSGRPTPGESVERSETSEEAILRRARRRARAEYAFYTHLTGYLSVIAMLALINFFTTAYPWFLWPALGWGIGILSHYMAVFGSRTLEDRYFYPAVEREVRRETMAARTEKRASIDELSASIAHEIRNPIAAAKSLVQQMGEDPRSLENVEYASVALEELDRVESSISHLLKYAREEDLEFDRVKLADVLDRALAEMRAKFEAGHVAVARNYIGGPTLVADGSKLQQVFVNILDNAIDSFADEKEERRIDLHIDGELPGRVRVRVRDNGGGIPEEKIERIFNPFFTTKETGTGLGLTGCRRIARELGGDLRLYPRARGGARAVLWLPRADALPNTAQAVDGDVCPASSC